MSDACNIHAHFRMSEFSRVHIAFAVYSLEHHEFQSQITIVRGTGQLVKGQNVVEKCIHLHDDHSHTHTA